MSRTWHNKREANYRKSRRFDATCRCHGSCPQCQGNRSHKFVRSIPADEHEQVEEGYVADGTECYVEGYIRSISEMG